MKLEQYLQSLRECPDKSIEIPNAVGWKIHRKPDGTIESRRKYRGTRKITLLEYKFGIYDNWPMLIGYDFEKLICLLQSSGRFTEKETLEDGSKINRRFDYVPGTVKIQVRNYVPDNCFTSMRSLERLHGLEKAHCERQRRNYKCTIMFHDYGDKKMEGVCNDRALAIAICDIGSMLIERKIPVCLTITKSIDHPEKDFSHIVYFPDSVYNEMLDLARELGEQK